MSLTTNLPEAQDELSLQNRVTELESVLRTILIQINTHQIYDLDARVVIRQALSGGVRISKNVDRPQAATAPRRATEFPSFFSSASHSQNLL